MAVPAMTIEGDVVAIHSYWADDGSRIVTEATVHTPDGADVVVSQLGGTVDGLAMVMMPGPAPLVVGMTVAVSAYRGVDRSHNEHLVLDGVKVLAYPPGFVRTSTTKSGKPLYWESGCAFVTVDSAGTTAIAGGDEFPIIDAAIDEWNRETDSCSYFKVVDEGQRSVDVNGKDHVNVIKFRDAPCTCDNGSTSWACRPAVDNDAARCAAASAAAITTVTYVNDPESARDGAIVDADIELNGVNFAISVNDQTTSTASCKADLQNTLTHELGHLHGLEHTCTVATDPPRVDDAGNPVPDCSSVILAPTLPANMKILDATMYNFQDCGETKKQTLSPDDIDAICRVYPTADDPGTCEQVATTAGGCCSASVRPDASLVLGAVVLLMLRRRRAADRVAARGPRRARSRPLGMRHAWRRRRPRSR